MSIHIILGINFIKTHTHRRAHTHTQTCTLLLNTKTTSTVAFITVENYINALSNKVHVDSIESVDPSCSNIVITLEPLLS